MTNTHKGSFYVRNRQECILKISQKLYFDVTFRSFISLVHNHFWHRAKYGHAFVEFTIRPQASRLMDRMILCKRWILSFYYGTFVLLRTPITIHSTLDNWVHNLEFDCVPMFAYSRMKSYTSRIRVFAAAIQNRR